MLIIALVYVYEVNPQHFSSCHRDTQASGKLSFNREFFDERWSRHRTVTCLDWSTQVLEDDNLLLLFPSNRLHLKLFNFVEEEECIGEVVAPEQLQKCKKELFWGGEEGDPFLQLVNVPLVAVLTLYSLKSECIFSKLFSKHFLRYQHGEFV